MPPADYGTGSPYDYAPADPGPTEPPPPRFSRNQLDATGQKIFDQLKQQREFIEKSAGADQAKQLYSDLTGLTKDETTALMAAELQSTGVTDIYKVKKDQQRIPIQAISWSGSGSEGGYESGTDYYMPDGSPIPPNLRVQQDPQGNYYAERTGYINTETGQAITPNAGGPFSGREGILSDYSVARRRDIGTGVQFTPEGVPIYFSQGEATPSSWKRFTNSIRPLLPIAAMLIPGIGQAFSGIASSLLGAGASQAAVSALSQGIASGLAGTIATGDIGQGIKSGLLSGAVGYGLGAAKGLADVAYVPEVSASQLAAIDTGPLPGMEGMPQLTPDSTFLGLDEVDKLFGSTARPGVSSFDADLGMELLAPEIDMSYGPQPMGPMAEGDLTQLASGEVPPTGEIPRINPDWDTQYSSDPNAAVPQGSLAAEVGPPQPLVGPPEPLVGPPEPLVGPPPPPLKASMMTPGMFDPASAMETQLEAAPQSLLDRGVAALTAAGSNFVDKLLTPQGILTAGAMIAQQVDRKNQKDGDGGGGGPAGWSGTIPRYTVKRERIPEAFERVPYSTAPTMGRAFFKPLEFQPRQPVATPTTQEQPVPSDNNPVVPAAQGGIMALNNGRYLRGPSDGMADELMTSIDGVQPAALSHGEFVIPADVVSHLGNGNSDAGAKVLYNMMDRVRKARTGTTQQGKQINPNRFVPGGIVQLSNGGSTGATQFSGGTTGVGAPTSTSSNLSTWAAPVVTENIGRLEALAQEEYQPYTGQLTATVSPVQGKTFEAAKSFAEPGRQWSATTMNTYMNPYLEGVQKPMLSALEREADKRQQQIQSEFTRAGAFGGARDVIARMENERALAEQKERVLGKTQADAYTQAADMYGRMRGQELQDLLGMLRVGGEERAIEKETIDALRAEYDKQQAEPMRRLKEFSDVMSKLPIETTTKKTDLSTLEQLGLDISRGMDLYKILDGMFGPSSKTTT